MAELVVEHLVKEFATPAGPLSVLRDVSFALELGQSLALLGPSGSGKSTLLHIVGTLDSPTTGRVLLRGEDPFRLGEAELAAFRNQNIGFVFQEHHLLPQLSVLENTLIPALALGSPTGEQVDRARMLLDRVGLTPRLGHRPAQLSGGERQRVAIARALLQRPALVLADEPTGNLDRETAQTVARLLLDLQRAERTILIVVTHSQDVAELCERRLTFSQGQLQ